MSSSRSAQFAELPTAVGLLGGGVIGGGWAARFILNGVDVRLFDPAPDAERRVRRMVENAARAYRSLTMVPQRDPGELSFVGSIEAAVERVSFVQESAPEGLAIKRDLLAAASAAAGPDTVISSSTSGLRPTELQAAIQRPGRLVVGHPFNPVYLVPLVEVCAGERTDPEAVELAVGLYDALGMHPLVVRREIDGFIADRLLEALWREALWLVHDDVATVAEVDDAIRYGAGLRWAFMGTFLTYRIGGGERGMRHFLSQFGPALQAPWTKLMDVPDLTPELIETLAAQSDEQARGAKTDELERWRDDCLVGILQALRAVGAGAGETVGRWEQGLLAASANTELAGAELAVPLALNREEVPPGWVDYNGHVHESHYLHMFGDATDAVLRLLGVDDEYVASAGSFYTVETHISHLGPAFTGDRLTVQTQVLGFDGKRLHLFHRLLRERDSAELATAEQMTVHVHDGRASMAEGEVARRAGELARTHAILPRPERAGRAIGSGSGAAPP